MLETMLLNGATLAQVMAAAALGLDEEAPVSLGDESVDEVAETIAPPTKKVA